jgi:hypothetical protein
VSQCRFDFAVSEAAVPLLQAIGPGSGDHVFMMPMQRRRRKHHLVVVLEWRYNPGAE